MKTDGYLIEGNAKYWFLLTMLILIAHLQMSARDI